MAAFLTTVLVFGCGHGDKGPFDDPEGGGEIPEIESSFEGPYEVAVSLTAVRVHSIEFTFAAPMVEETVDFRLLDDGGSQFDVRDSYFLTSSKKFIVTGPFQFCRTYGFTLLAGAEDGFGNVLEEDVFIEVPVGPNPYDIDRTAYCSADVAISPVFTDELDGMILAGDDASEVSGVKALGRGDMDTDLVWYVDGSQFHDYGDRMAIIPDLAGTGTTGAAKLFMWNGGNLKNYELEIWDSYDPVYELSSTTVHYEISENFSNELAGPFDAGDLNGDGAREILLSNLRSTNGHNLLQRVMILEGPIPSGVDIFLEEEASVNIFLGALGEVLRPYVSVGDIDGDGYDDMAAISYSVTSSGATSGWHVDIVHGSQDILSSFYPASQETIRGTIGRDIVDIDGGDIDGDGISDLIIADVKRTYAYGETKYKKPRVMIFFGGGKLDGKYMDQADVEISIYMTYIQYTKNLSIRMLGDINGDGIEDLGMGTMEENSAGFMGMSNVYVLLGRREMWPELMKMGPHYYSPEWALRISSGSNNVIVLKDNFWDPRVGDIDNDGFYDFMLKVFDYTGQSIILLPGDAGIVTEGRNVALDEVPATWDFSAP